MTNRFGTVVLLQGGDREISQALADGVMRGRLRADQMRVVKDEFHRHKASEALERFELRRGRDERYWSELCFQAEMAYGESLLLPTMWEKFCEKAELIWCTVWIVLSGQERRNMVRRRRHR